MQVVQELPMTAVTIAAAVWDRVLSAANHNIASSAGRRLRQLDASSITDGTAQAGTSNSITLAAGAASTNEIYDSNLIVITEGTGAGQTRVIVEYNGTSKVAYVNRVWEVTPDATSVYEVIAGAQEYIAQHGLAQGGAASTITLSSTASATDDIYVGNLVFISTSNGTGQTRLITAYNGTTKVATVSPAWAVNPTSASVYSIMPMGRTIVDTNADKTGYSLTSTDWSFPKNTAKAAFTFPMYDSSGDPATGLTVTAQRSLDGAALGSCANAVSEIGNGLYKIDLAAADLNADVVGLRFTATGAKPTLATIVTQAS